MAACYLCPYVQAFLFVRRMQLQGLGAVGKPRTRSHKRDGRKGLGHIHLCDSDGSTSGRCYPDNPTGHEIPAHVIIEARLGFQNLQFYVLVAVFKKRCTARSRAGCGRTAKKAMVSASKPPQAAQKLRNSPGRIERAPQISATILRISLQAVAFG